MCNDLVHLLILLSCTNYTLYSCYYYLIHGAVLHTAIAIKVKLQPFRYIVGLASHLAAKVSLQHRGYAWNQNNPLLLPTSFLDVLNIVRSVYNVTVWKVPSSPSQHTPFQPFLPVMLNGYYLFVSPQAVFMHTSGSEHAVCPGFQCRYCPSWLLSVFPSEKTRRRLGMVCTRSHVYMCSWFP